MPGWPLCASYTQVNGFARLFVVHSLTEIAKMAFAPLAILLCHALEFLERAVRQFLLPVELDGFATRIVVEMSDLDLILALALKADVVRDAPFDGIPHLGRVRIGAERK
jgi:hypothetical protein